MPAFNASPFTEREIEVLDLLADPTQLTLDEIAERLVITRNTLKTHLKHIYEKLSVSTRPEAVRRWRKITLSG